MKAKAVSFSNVIRLVGIDILLISMAYILPAVSHLFAFPLYKADPMRIIVLSGLLLTANRKNAYLLAVTVPLFSFFATGHPVLPKNLLIMAELLVNIALFSWFSNRMKSVFASMLTAIVCSKLLYYGLKWILVSTALLDMSFVSTGIVSQLLVSVVISAVFALVCLRQRRS